MFEKPDERGYSRTGLVLDALLHSAVNVSWNALRSFPTRHFPSTRQTLNPTPQPCQGKNLLSIGECFQATPIYSVNAMDTPTLDIPAANGWFSSEVGL